ncbi:DedA family protein [Streptomyces sp. RKND-216]|uniref:DedA family protein n=1 Tax=Streptomyces sp. RKND-216 TaxID=2562581 RepID=UPI00109DD074|nr:VTT domain-containing protein [Streptomyces sp. RKND-216]THA23724.1 DedA family protein [Streptomyces sp. RKND-216]
MTADAVSGLGQLASAASTLPVDTQQVIAYPTLFVLIAFGALVPVVPTGALVSSVAVVAFHQAMPVVPLFFVFAVASLAAFAGDVALYWLGSRGLRSKGGSVWLERLRQKAPPDRLEQARRGLERHGVAVLVVSRLVPAGRIPVMLACLLAHLRLRTFVRGNLPACLAWAATYQLVGVVGGSLFPEPWEGVAAAVGLALLVSFVPSVWRRFRGPRVRDA